MLLYYSLYAKKTRYLYHRYVGTAVSR